MLDTHTSILLANAKYPKKYVTLNLPFAEEDLKKAACAIGITDEDPEEISEQITVSQLTSDYTISDYGSIFELSDLIERIEEFDCTERDLLDALLEDGVELEDAIEQVEDGDIEFYPQQTLEEVAQQLAHEHLFSTAYLLNNVNWEAVASDLEDDGYVETDTGVFRREP